MSATSRTLALAFATLTLGGVQPATAVTILINNGLAPPNPENVIDDFLVMGTFDLVKVRNAGCGAAPGLCTAPGAPTTVAIVDGGVAANVLADGSSHVDMQGGDVYGLFLAASGSASISMTGGNVHFVLEASEDSQISFLGGYVEAQVRGFDAAHITIAGGSIGSGGAQAEIRTFNQALIEIIGSDFAIDGIPVAFGDISAASGRITGRLASGDLLDDRFERVSGQGTIRLIANPEPGTGLLVALGLLALGAARRRAPGL